MGNNEHQQLPLPKVVGIWEDDFDPYPTIFRVSFPKGQVINYYRPKEGGPPLLRGPLDHFNETCQVKKGGKRRAKRYHAEAGAAGMPGVAADGQG